MSLFFLMCSERSGSNFITKLLNGHHNICGPSTKHIINPVARNIFRYGDISQEANWNELLNDIHRLLSVDFSVWKKEFSLQDLKDLAPIGDIKSLLQNIFLEEARAHGKQHVFIKENHLYEFLPFLQHHFPESKFIYQTRDPRDMALSWKKNLVHPGGIVKASLQWKQDQQQSLKNHFLLKSEKKSHLVRYEDLIKNSEQEITNIVDFLGLPHDDNITNFYLDETTHKNAGSQTSWENLSKPIMTDNSDKYLSELADDEILIIESICQNEMKHLGYAFTTTSKERNEITAGHIQSFSQEEEAKLDYKPNDGVIKNMAAKKVFYCR